MPPKNTPGKIEAPVKKKGKRAADEGEDKSDLDMLDGDALASALPPTPEQGASAASSHGGGAVAAGALSQATAADPEIPAEGDMGTQLAAIQRQLASLAGLLAQLAGLVGLEARMGQHLMGVEANLRSHVSEELAPVKAQLAAHGQTLEEHTELIHALARRVDSLESGAASQATSPPGSPGLSTRPAATAAPPAEFEPAFVEARGWATFETRRTQGLTRAQCQVIVDRLREHLSEEVRQHVGALSVPGYRSYTFRVAVRGGFAVVREVAGVANDLVADGTLSLPEGVAQGSSLRFNAERSPQAQARLQGLLRALRAVEALVARKKAGDDAADWAEVKAEPNFREATVEVLMRGGARLQVASFALGGSATWNVEGLTFLGVASGPQLLAAAPPERR